MATKMATQTESAGPSAVHSQAHAHETHVRAMSLGKRFPITAFGICLGLAGSSIMWNAVASTPFTRRALGDGASAMNWAVWSAACVVYGLVMAAFAAMVWYHPAAVRREWEDPVLSYFFVGPHISLLMICLGTPEEVTSLGWRRAAWSVGLLAQIVLTRFYYLRWLFRQHTEPKATFDGPSAQCPSAQCPSQGPSRGPSTASAFSLDGARPQYFLSTIGHLLGPNPKPSPDLSPNPNPNPNFSPNTNPNPSPGPNSNSNPNPSPTLARTLALVLTLT